MTDKAKIVVAVLAAAAMIVVLHYVLQQAPSVPSIQSVTGANPLAEGPSSAPTMADSPEEAMLRVGFEHVTYLELGVSPQ